MGKLVIFSAPSGAGKTSIVHELLKVQDLKLEFSVSATNRPPREGETDGKDYYFLSTEAFNKKIKNKEFIEWEEVYMQNFYGTLKSEIERIWRAGNNVIFDVDVVGGLNIKKQYNSQALSVFIKPPSIAALRKRLIHRGTESIEKINQRVEKAEFELDYATEFDEIIVNDDLSVAIEKAKKIVREFLI